MVGQIEDEGLSEGWHTIPREGVLPSQDANEAAGKSRQLRCFWIEQGPLLRVLGFLKRCPGGIEEDAGVLLIGAALPDVLVPDHAPAQTEAAGPADLRPPHP